MGLGSREWLHLSAARVFLAIDVVRAPLDLKFKVGLHDVVRGLGSETRGVVGFIPVVESMIEDEPIGRKKVGAESRSGAVGRERVHFQKIRGRRQLGQKVIEKRVVIVRPPQIGRADKEPLTR